ncbi:MAG TPA: hypothetical protein VGL45_00200 [Bradyrhizobium sp.]|jgi:hypothetical protein
MNKIVLAQASRPTGEALAPGSPCAARWNATVRERVSSIEKESMMGNDRKPTQGIVRTGRGEEQPGDKDRARRQSGNETSSSDAKPDFPVGKTPGRAGHSKDANEAPTE